MALSLGRFSRLLGSKPAAEQSDSPNSPVAQKRLSSEANTSAGVEQAPSPEDAESYIRRVTDGVAVIQVSEIETSPHAGTLRFSSHDPWVSFEFSKLAADSLLGELTIEAEPVIASDRVLYGKLYFDIGEGYQEKFSTQLSADGRTTLTALVAAPALFRSLRWDPDERDNELKLKRVSFTPIQDKDHLMERLRVLAGDADRRASTALAELVAPRLFSQQVETGEEAFELTRRLTEACFRSSMYKRSRKMRGDFDDLTEFEVEQLRSDVSFLVDPPLISIITPVYRTGMVVLSEMIESVQDQIYPFWELCIADDFTQDEKLTAALEGYAERDSRIKVVHRDRNGHISAASNSALEVAAGEWIVLLDHDDVLTPDALMRIAQELQVDPSCEIIYSDEDKLDPSGLRIDAFRKPDFSIELFRSQNYLNHLTAVRTSSVRAVGGWRIGYEGSQDHDMLLRVIDRGGAVKVRHIPRILYHWRMAEGSTAVAVGDKSYAFVSGVRALEDHLRRLGKPGHVEKTPRMPYYRIRFDLPDPPPRVSLIIPTRDRADILEICVRSILLKTDYPDFEVLIIDNGSIEARTLELFSDLQQDDRVRIIPFDAPFNFSSINNFGVAQTNAPLIAMINNDIEVISPDWLSEMVSWTVQSDVGCVGAKLYYPNDTIQHAGVIISLGGVAGHSHKYFPRDSLGYFGRLSVTQDLSAVTAACLLVRRSVFLEVGGLNEKDLAVAFNDVDFCLRVREAGYRNIFTPFAELYHHESASRGAEDDPVKIARFNREIGYMHKRWGSALFEDPFYSPHLTKAREDFSPG